MTILNWQTKSQTRLPTDFAWVINPFRDGAIGSKPQLDRQKTASIKLDANRVLPMSDPSTLDLSRDIHPLSSFKRNTPDFIAQLKQTGAPVVLTINGKAEVVVQDAAAYQKLLDLVTELETILGIKRGLEDVKAGLTRPIADFAQDMQQKYGLSS
jgi:PHD/YefM family antitoxin component YafN of YafNO toxin-antitoxin module